MKTNKQSSEVWPIRPLCLFPSPPPEFEALCSLTFTFFLKMYIYIYKRDSNYVRILLPLSVQICAPTSIKLCEIAFYLNSRFCFKCAPHSHLLVCFSFPSFTFVSSHRFLSARVYSLLKFPPKRRACEEFSKSLHFISHRTTDVNVDVIQTGNLL